MRKFTSFILIVLVLFLVACERQSGNTSVTSASSLPSTSDDMQIALPETTQAYYETLPEIETAATPSAAAAQPTDAAQAPAATTIPPLTPQPSETKQQPENGSPSFTVNALRVSRRYAENANPTAAVADSRDALDEALRTLTDDDERSVGVKQEDVAAYTDEWFGAHRLILIALQENSGSVRHEIRKVSYTDRGAAVKIKRTVPSVQTCDIAHWLILIELDDTRLHAGDPVELELLMEN